MIVKILSTVSKLWQFLPLDLSWERGLVYPWQTSPEEETKINIDANSIVFMSHPFWPKSNYLNIIPDGFWLKKYDFQLSEQNHHLSFGGKAIYELSSLLSSDNFIERHSPYLWLSHTYQQQPLNLRLFMHMTATEDTFLKWNKEIKERWIRLKKNSPLTHLSISITVF